MTLLKIVVIFVTAGTLSGADFNDMTDNTWTRIADAPGDKIGREVPPGRGATWVYVPNTQKFLRYGGYTPTYSNAMDEFDPATKNWRRVLAHDETYPSDRPGGGCSWMLAYDSVRNVIWMGGAWTTGNSSGNGGVWKYDLSTYQFTKIANPLNWKTHYVFDPVNYVIVCAPGAYGSDVSYGTNVYNLSSNVWENRITDSLPQSYYNGGHPCIYDPSIGKVVLFRNGVTWHYDAAENKWEQVTVAGTAPTEKITSLSYDPVNQVILRYGGSDGRNRTTYKNETWIYKGSTRAWTKLTCPGIPVWSQSKTEIRPLFYHQALAYYPVQRCFLLCDPDLGVWAFRYNPSSAAGTEIVGAEPLVTGAAAGNTPMEGASDIFKAFPSAFNNRFVNMPNDTILTLSAGTGYGTEITMDYDPDLGLFGKYGGCGNGSNPYWGGYGNNLVFFDPGSEEWFLRRTSDASGIARPGNGCGRSTIYDSNRKKWWFFGGQSGEPYPCLAPSVNGPWSYDFKTDLFTDHNVTSIASNVPRETGGLNLQYSPEFDITIWPDSNRIFIFDFKTLLWQQRAVSAGPSAPAGHAGNIVWVSSIKKFLCFRRGVTWVYDPSTNLWTDLQPAVSPPAREVKMGLAYDSHNDIVLLVGGSLRWNEAPVKDMWVYHPSLNTWEQKNPVNSSFWSRGFYDVEQTAYDSRHNVFFIGFESGSMYAYRYKRNPVISEAVLNKNELPILVSASPNPFSTSTLLTVNSKVNSLKIYDARGRVVDDLTQSIKQHKVIWKSNGRTPGLYFAVAKTAHKTLSYRCMLIK